MLCCVLCFFFSHVLKKQEKKCCPQKEHQKGWLCKQQFCLTVCCTGLSVCDLHHGVRVDWNLLGMQRGKMFYFTRTVDLVLPMYVWKAARALLQSMDIFALMVLLCHCSCFSKPMVRLSSCSRGQAVTSISVTPAHTLFDTLFYSGNGWETALGWNGFSMYASESREDKQFCLFLHFLKP